MWTTKIKVDWPYTEIGRKMVNGQLLFCTLPSDDTLAISMVATPSSPKLAALPSF